METQILTCIMFKISKYIDTNVRTHAHAHARRHACAPPPHPHPHNTMITSRKLRMVLWLIVSFRVYYLQISQCIFHMI